MTSALTDSGSNSCLPRCTRASAPPCPFARLERVHGQVYLSALTSLGVTAERRLARAQHIAAVAADLFYRYGIHVVGVDQIAAKAEITKKTLYRYYRSKDLLVEAALRQPLGLRFPRDGSPTERVIGAFRAMGEYLVDHEFRGCPFINAAAELANRRHPARSVLVEATTQRRRWFTGRAFEEGLDDPELIGEQLDVLFDGALANAMKRADMTPVRAATLAAERLFSTTGTVHRTNRTSALDRSA